MVRIYDGSKDDIINSLLIILFDHYFFGQPAPQHVSFEIRGNCQLSLAVVGNDLNFVILSQSHCQKPHFCAGAAADFFNDQFLSWFCQCQRHQLNPLPEATFTNTVDFQFMLQHMKSMSGSDFYLQLFDLCFFKFQYGSAFCADHVVVMLSQMSVFVEHDAIVKAAFVGKTEATQQFECFFHKLIFQSPAIALKPFNQLFDRYVFFCLQKNFEDFKSIFKIIDLFLFKELLKLLLFLDMDLLHLRSKLTLPDLLLLTGIGRKGTKKGGKTSNKLKYVPYCPGGD